MSRGASSTSSPLVSTFPSHLDLAAPMSLHGPPRNRSTSSDSSYSASSTSQSSQVSSPTSTCTELQTPIMPTFHAVAQPEAAFLGNMHVPSPFIGHQMKSEAALSEAQFAMPPPTFVPASYAPLDPTFSQQVTVMPAPAPLTYSSLASSSSANRNIGLKILGMHSDPFLMSQPLPSPSLLFGTTGNPIMSSSTALMLGPHQLTSGEQQQYSQPIPSAFENLLRFPSGLSASTSASETTSSEDACFTGSTPSLCSSQPQVSSGSDDKGLGSLADALEAACDTGLSRSATLSLEAAIAECANRPRESASAAASRSMRLASHSFSAVVEKIGARFGLFREAQDLPQLLSRLQLSGKLDQETEACKGLVFDAAIDWDAMGSNMLPTTEQLLYPHRAFIDVCLPWPSVRSRLLKHSLTHPISEEELALDLLLSVVSCDEALNSFHVYGDDVLDPECWELSEGMVTKWWGLFDESIIRRTNWWRRQRGLPQLSLPTPSETANEAEQQGLGTGSLDQAHHLATTLLH